MAETIRHATSEVLSGFDETTTTERRRAWWGSDDPVLMAHALRLMERSEADIVAAVAGDGRRVDVVVAAIDTLQYYPSRRVLRAVAGMLDATDERVRATAAASFEFLQGSFECLATEGDPAVAELLREWMAPVRDLIAWPEDIDVRQGDGSDSAPARPPRTTLSARELLELVADPDGQWATTTAILRNVEWTGYEAHEQDQLAKALTAHPDPVVRQIAGPALATWSRSHNLLVLADDPSLSVRKSALYHLGLVPRDPALAGPVWARMTRAHGRTALEALETYIVHAAPVEARARLAELANTHQREEVVTRAIAGLVDLGAVAEVESLLPLLREAPGVTGPFT